MKDKPFYAEISRELQDRIGWSDSDMQKRIKNDGNLLALGYRREFESSILKGTRTHDYQLSKDAVIITR